MDTAKAEERHLKARSVQSIRILKVLQALIGVVPNEVSNLTEIRSRELIALGQRDEELD